MSFSRRHWVTSVLVFATATLAAGQNCTAPQSTAGGGQQSSVSAHGGDGYDGKLFVNRLVGELCADRSDVKSSVLVESPRVAYVTRENCQPVNNRALTSSDFSFMPHNVNNLIFTNRAFDLEPKMSQDPRLTTYLCRGGETAAYYSAVHGLTVGPDFKDRYADMIFKPSGGGHVARMLMGLYEQGSVEKLSGAPYDSGEFAATLEFPSVGPMVFYGTDAQGVELSVMLARTASGVLTGKAIYLRDSGLPPRGPTDMPDFNFNVNCYPQ